MKKIKKKIISFILSFIMFINFPLCGLSVSYADAITDYNPALLPIFILVSSVMMGSGIRAEKGADALNQLTNNVIDRIKTREVARSEADENYNSAYRVINGGKMEKPNNNNKNGKWFGLGVASALGSAVAFEKGATEDIMRTVDELNGYKPMQGSAGILSANDMITQCSSGQIALQLANLSNSAVTQFDKFLHSDFWVNYDISPNDVLFAVNTNIGDILAQNPKYPTMYINMILKSDDLKYVDVPNGVITYYTFNNKYGSLSYYYINNSGTNYSPHLLNQDNVALRVKRYSVEIPARSAEEEFSYRPIIKGSMDNIFYVGSIGNYNDHVNYAYSGYKWQSQNPWSFTNNVYNSTQNFNVNFPDWMQESFNLLGQNVEGIRLGIDSLNDYWQNTQQNVQIGETPENVIAQLLNNYLNPEVAPDPNPDPDPNPNPDPDPNPDPKPYAPEVFLPFSEPDLDDGVEKLWDWTVGKITLPDGFWDKIPFSIPYDVYLLTSSMFPVGGGGSGNRRMLRAVMNSPTDPNGITISSTFEAFGVNTRQYNMSNNKWVQNAPVINLDLHFKYHDTSGSERTLDYVKTVDLAPYAYFAMIIYIAIYISWFGVILGFIVNMFK